MKKLLLLILLQGVFNISFCQNCYRTIPFTHTPLYAFKGGLEVNNEVDSVAVYHFQYEDKRLKRVDYQINGKFKPLYENYTCSDFIWAAVNLFEYSDDKVIIRHLNYLEKPLEDNPAVSVYLNDKQGRVIGLKYFDKKNNPTEFKGIHEYKWKYLENGIGEIRYSADGHYAPMSNWFPYEWVILNFDQHKNLKSILTTDVNWKYKENAIKVDFNAKDHEITRWIATDIKTGGRTNFTGPKVAETRHTFNENGYLIMTRFYDKGGKRTQSTWGHTGFKRAYNTQGNRQKYNFINEDDKIVLSEERGYSGQKFIWGKDGRFRLQTFYINEKEDAVFRESKGYAQIQYLYNYLGEIVGEIYKNEVNKILNTDLVESFILLENKNGVKEKVIIKK